VGPEAEVERTVCREAAADGWRVYKLQFLNKRGAPDRMFGKAGRVVLIEFKAPGQTPNEQQKRRHAELRTDCGLEVHICRTVEHGREVLGLREA